MERRLAPNFAVLARAFSKEEALKMMEYNPEIVQGDDE